MHVGQVAAIDTHYGIRLTWTPTTATDFEKYSVYMSKTTGRNYEYMGDSENPEFVIPSLQAGTYYFIIHVHDNNGNMSEASEEIRIILQ